MPRDAQEKAAAATTVRLLDKTAKSGISVAVQREPRHKAYARGWNKSTKSRINKDIHLQLDPNVHEQQMFISETLYEAKGKAVLY